ncbi:MAG TPA: hydrogenase nickel incorporation protein HypB [Methylocella sp.]|nr:hydrogenase nickel incorporation protein HypB [Methylocella sp.]
MCATCGCQDGADAKIINIETGKTLSEPPAHHPHHHHHHDHAEPHLHSHGHEHGHHHHHDPGDVSSHRDQAQSGSTMRLEQSILAKNDAIAARNRAWFAGREILALNLVSSPGAGKTAVLERTLRGLQKTQPCFVIEGDQATSNDSERIKDAGAPAIQINTGSGCHLDASMVARALSALKPSFRSIVMIENVGNLVCPALFDLGEHAKVLILSVTEGEDKPVKYPHMFEAARLLLINKIDLLPHLAFDLDRCMAYARQVNPGIEILALSAATGEGFDAWHAWILNALSNMADGPLQGHFGAAP